MRSLFFVLLTGLLVSYIPTTLKKHFPDHPSKPISKKEREPISEANLLYDKMNLGEVLKFEAFEQALQGYHTLHPKKTNILTVIDFTLPSTEKRMVVIDMEKEKVLFRTIVSHGRNSGEKYAKSFSNKHGSYQSSLGFFLTENTYQGGNGYSLVLNGLEKGINDQAKARAVVIHGADYCSESTIKSTGRLGRSYGCPALPRELTKPIINAIKNGSLLYIYADNPQYLAKTTVLNTISSRGLLAQHNEIMGDSLENLN
ncbi:murein L,D-transpeptidase catalytic domain family protein [Sphingobacterium sp. LRF_L2]|uniref:murein L,D-transpeptidase catalytic domain family protein n=1 Tax=Sphingobacterium sp. LRF_L2 TaxID=3369421 RepID=UPI003F5D645D